MDWAPIEGEDHGGGKHGEGKGRRGCVWGWGVVTVEQGCSRGEWGGGFQMTNYTIFRWDYNHVESLGVIHLPGVNSENLTMQGCELRLKCRCGHGKGYRFSKKNLRYRHGRDMKKTIFFIILYTFIVMLINIVKSQCFIQSLIICNNIKKYKFLPPSF